MPFEDQTPREKLRRVMALVPQKKFKSNSIMQIVFVTSWFYEKIELNIPNTGIAGE